MEVPKHLEQVVQPEMLEGEGQMLEVAPQVEIEQEYASAFVGRAEGVVYAASVSLFGGRIVLGSAREFISRDSIK